MVYVFPIDDTQRSQCEETSECIPRWLSIETLAQKLERKDFDSHLLRESFPLVIHAMYHDETLSRDLEIPEPSSQLKMQLPSSDTLLQVECQCQYGGKGPFVIARLHLTGFAELKFLSSMNAGASCLRSVSVKDCAVGLPKNRRIGHDYALRLNTAETDLQAKVRLPCRRACKHSSDTLIKTHGDAIRKNSFFRLKTMMTLKTATSFCITMLINTVR